ncbi:hypothetical protein GCM10009868_34870 [Terrabacter aerolatus]|uniref:(2Fe-2S) ferredoxin domain-containing protein n=1 Tax=Terrabacter aerolatus TaxID=422442 RepID=A0A512CWC4_9MICO|nr:hypothetical protein [Terrabacter aerolatus]GEO28528.1 hypothetical protein TAE01_03380 [Terrabacter aerolatus]
MTAHGNASADSGSARTCIVRACRDCCCGTERKHPGVDHDGLLDRLQAGTRGSARVLRSACLLACEESNVVVVTPSTEGRQAGGRPVWVRGVLDDASVDAVTGWVTEGGPGVAPLPSELDDRVFAPSGLSLTWTRV